MWFFIYCRIDNTFEERAALAVESIAKQKHQKWRLFFAESRLQCVDDVLAKHSKLDRAQGAQYNCSIDQFYEQVVQQQQDCETKNDASLDVRAAMIDQWTIWQHDHLSTLANVMAPRPMLDFVGTIAMIDGKQYPTVTRPDPNATLASGHFEPKPQDCDHLEHFAFNPRAHEHGDSCASLLLLKKTVFVQTPMLSDSLINCDWTPETRNLVFINYYHGDIEWRHNLHLPYIIFSKNMPERGLYNARNVAKSESNLLKFIADHYDSLPRSITMVHQYERKWTHDDSIGECIDKADKVDMSQTPFVSIGRHRMEAAAIGDKALHMMYSHWWLECMKPYFGYLKPYGDFTLGKLAGAQFRVSREAIRRLPREFYANMYQFFCNHCTGTERGEAFGLSTDNFYMSRFMEWMWELIFTAPVLAQPPANARQLAARQAAKTTPQFWLFTNVRDELRLQEWIDHHLSLGFTRIVIYDHKSVEPVRSTDPRVFVERVEQPAPIKHFLMERAVEQSVKNQVDWLIYIDADEFICLQKHDNVEQFLNDVIAVCPDASQVALNWLMFGSGGHDTEPIGTPMIEAYTKAENKLNKHIKTFVRPEMAQDKVSFSPHFYPFVGVTCNCNGQLVQDHQRGEFGTPFNTNVPQYLCDANAFLAHYYHQSYESYIERKVARERDDTGTMRQRLSKEQFHQMSNDVECLIMSHRYGTKK